VRWSVSGVSKEVAMEVTAREPVAFAHRQRAEVHRPLLGVALIKSLTTCQRACLTRSLLAPGDRPADSLIIPCSVPRSCASIILANF
jgi:hypothetical protein